MTTTPILFPELRALYDQYLTAKDSDERSTINSNVISLLRRTNVATTADNSKDQALELGLYWLGYFAIELNNTGYGASRLYAHDMDKFFHMALDNNLVPNIVRSQKNRNIFACVCLKALALANRTGGLKENSLIPTVLETWTGKVPTKDNLASLPSSIDYLYGPAVWTFFRDEVKNDSEMLSHLYGMNLPLPEFQPGDARAGKDSIMEMLPTDFS